MKYQLPAGSPVQRWRLLWCRGRLPRYLHGGRGRGLCFKRDFFDIAPHYDATGLHPLVSLFQWGTMSLAMGLIRGLNPCPSSFTGGGEGSISVSHRKVHPARSSLTFPGNLYPQLRQGYPKSLAADQHYAINRSNLYLLFPPHQDLQAGGRRFDSLDIIRLPAARCRQQQRHENININGDNNKSSAMTVEH